jgi:hypothetical protein
VLPVTPAWAGRERQKQREQMRKLYYHRKAHGLTFWQLAERTAGNAGKQQVLREILPDEQRRGRIMYDGRRYVLVPSAFHPDVLAALRDLQPLDIPDESQPAAQANGKPWRAGAEAAAWPDLARQK